MPFKTGKSGIGRRALAIGCAAAVSIILVSAPLANFANDSLKRRYPLPGVMVSIGTHRLHLYCEGSGGPAVILESGIGSGWQIWASVVTGLKSFSRVCVYDRAGYGWSEAGSDGATAARLAGEFRSLLVNAPVRGPYVLVAHSFGAYIARIYLDRFPGDLLGLVLVDPSHEDEPHRHSLYTRVHNLFPPSGLPGLMPFFEGERALPLRMKDDLPAFRHRFLVGFSYNEAVAARREVASLDASEAEVRAARFPRDLPLTVITATHVVTTDRVGQPEIPNSSLHFELQAQLVKLSSHGRQIVVNSGHFVQLERPDLIVRSIRQMIDCCRSELHPAAEAGQP